MIHHDAINNSGIFNVTILALTLLLSPPAFNLQTIIVSSIPFSLFFARLETAISKLITTFARVPLPRDTYC